MFIKSSRQRDTLITLACVVQCAQFDIEQLSVRCPSPADSCSVSLSRGTVPRIFCRGSLSLNTYMPAVLRICSGLFGMFRLGLWIVCVVVVVSVRFSAA